MTGLLPPGPLPPGPLPPRSFAPRSFAPWSFVPPPPVFYPMVFYPSDLCPLGTFASDLLPPGLLPPRAFAPRSFAPHDFEEIIFWITECFCLLMFLFSLIILKDFKSYQHKTHQIKYIYNFLISLLYWTDIGARQFSLSVHVTSRFADLWLLITKFTNSHS